ncbi:YGR068C-like protein [Saccharomyces cerevisiae x Saccharomyces kudriavzevii VIN7]|uniref:YGR068C-like protein n=1 Tax=Saccharomyces cerevisiae x Saccharomyces kudriavzevii (strain VIN7) TaxID=1095631 RepID=H0GV26_SACCK|nr:YGR068C-like protein [Saccharomyces cerevisiae x Saccharomyces kudriavzevii VIN7]CAI5272761.1 AIS_HP2_G0019560.mRNA.1.CDS.1 [Saccharomyces cerevisiae]CAI6519230.1 AIS_HP2_G0019560.mRNA.1.CDS.1 [Saccharomyces cerevisiae]
MFSLTSLSNGGGHSEQREREKITYFDIRIDSPYKDIILIQGSPLELSSIPLSGNLAISVKNELVVKRISLRLVGRFKLEFLQVGRYKKNSSSLASLVKEKRKIFECYWDNLLVSSQGDVLVGGDQTENQHGGSGSSGSGNTSGQDVDTSGNAMFLSKRSLSSPVFNKIIRRKTHSSHRKILELPENGVTGTPFEGLKEDGRSRSSSNSTYNHSGKDASRGSYLFLMKRGNYELPFNTMLPPEVCETIEGLQSGSILYSFEAVIDGRQLWDSDLTIHTSSNPTGSGTNTSGNGVRTKNKIAIKKFKYLRILRTLSMDNLAMQEEISVGDTWRDKLQYETSIPSRAVPIGSATPVKIKIFPFEKNIRLDRIEMALIQYYAMKDSSAQIYDDEIAVMKTVQLADFGPLTDKLDVDCPFTIPDNLKQITQDCCVHDNLIRVMHKLQVRILLQRQVDGEYKNLEIKAQLPMLLFISPHLPMQGRLVLFDKHDGKIHFRPGELVPLFATAYPTQGLTPGPALDSTVTAQLALPQPPPNYHESTNDHLVPALQPLGADSAALAVPSYEQAQASRSSSATGSVPAYRDDD